uniref:Uncharacterized protein n=2 Tax=Oryza sativa subsp. japonica TaxID=39947 RepID=Q75J34_ORYSJ|nr:hypothetical protein [Oryza sativa Japonica Group]ABF97793.1 hypothetical protein LOC_Os03g43620 [Oryza sativa Japonica Group]
MATGGRGDLRAIGLGDQLRSDRQYRLGQTGRSMPVRPRFIDMRGQIRSYVPHLSFANLIDTMDKNQTRPKVKKAK